MIDSSEEREAECARGVAGKDTDRERDGKKEKLGRFRQEHKIPWWRPPQRTGASPRRSGTPQALYHARPPLRATSFPTELVRLLTTHA